MNYDPEKFGEMKGTLTAILQSVARIEAAIQKQNGRVRKLEDWKLKIKTQAAIVSIIVSSITTVAIAAIIKYVI